MQIFNNSIKSFLNLFIENNCPLCDRSTSEGFCVYCTRSVETCRLENPSQSSHESYPLVVWGAYRGTLKRAIAKMKYHNHPEIGEMLGMWLGESWWDYIQQQEINFFGSDQKSNLKINKNNFYKNNFNHKNLRKNNYIVVPIPLHTEKLRQRGFNQAEAIAKGFCEVTQMKLVADGLVRKRETQAQHLLTASDRAKNLADAFLVGQSLQRFPSAQIILVDDIYTTGATVNAAIQILQKHNYQIGGVVAVATSSSSSFINNPS